MSSEFEGVGSYVNSAVEFIFLLTIINILFIVDTTLGSLVTVRCIILVENFSK